MIRNRWTVGLALAWVLLMASRTEAVYLDEERNFLVRGQMYTEASIATEGSAPQSPRISAGDVVSHRTFFNPEFEGDLSFAFADLGLDEVSFRVALWGFYDGVYDYLPGQWNRARRSIETRFSRGRTSSAPYYKTRTDEIRDIRQVYSYQADPVLGSGADIPFRINEAYFNVTKGRVSLRVGRQTISWGESDTIALLDQSNPFDLTRGVPGIFQDVDEARIPLWTFRSNVRLFDSWGPFSSAFLDVYLVPGSIDTTVTETPIPGGVSPYGPAEADPQEILASLTDLVPPDVEIVLDKWLGGLQLVQYDHRPARTMSNSRYGFRLESIINRDYTTSVWFYRTLSQIPVARFKPLDISQAPAGNRKIDPDNARNTLLITETVYRPVNVFGVSTSFFSSVVNGIIRLNLQYFVDEAGFIPSENIPFEATLRQPPLRDALRLSGADIEKGAFQGFIPEADYLRWEIGYDRFFFNRILNPSNSFIWVASLVGSWNMTETFTDKDFRYYGQRKLKGDGLRDGSNSSELEVVADIPDLHTVNEDFVDLHQVEWFVQSTLQTDYFHGRMSPRLTMVLNPRGTYVVNPSVIFRYSDSVHLTLRYAWFAGGFFGTGFFRDRDQVTARLTLLLN